MFGDVRRGLRWKLALAPPSPMRPGASSPGTLSTFDPPTPSPSLEDVTEADHQLWAVAGVSSSDVWAVGDFDDIETKPLAEHWDGKSWTVVDAPNAEGSFLALATISATDAWAVGSAGSKPLAATLEGGSLKATPTPAIKGYDRALLKGVAGVGPDDVWAVGFSALGDVTQALIEHWDGTKWTIARSPFLGRASNELSAVVAVTRTDAWAVGTRFEEGQDSASLVEHWDGRSWSVVPSPALNGSDSLSDVSVVSPSDIWAVGSRSDRSGTNFGFVEHVIVEHWDGNEWSVLRNVNTSGAPLEFQVEAISNNNVWYLASQFLGTDTMWHWDGARWEKVALPFESPEAPLTIQDINGMDAISATDVWAVGSSLVDAPERALIFHWNGAEWRTMPSPAVQSGT